MSLKIPNVEAILAIDSNNGFAKNGIIAWKSKVDMEFFRKKTIGNTVIMGSKTLISLPNSAPLKCRKNIVITSDVNKYSKLYKPSSELTFVDLKQALDIIKNNKDDLIYIIGGTQIFNFLLPYCNRIWLTKMKQNYNCDITFDYDLSSYSKEVIYEDNELEIICLQ